MKMLHKIGATLFFIGFIGLILWLAILIVFVIIKYKIGEELVGQWTIYIVSGLVFGGLLMAIANFKEIFATIKKSIFNG